MAKANDRRKGPKAVAKSVKNSHTSPAVVALQEKRAEALEYRKQGYSYPQIAAAMSIGVTTAFEYVDYAIKAITQEAAHEVLKMELERLNDFQAATFASAAEGDIPSIDVNLRISDRRARLLGLYPDGKGGFTVEHTTAHNGAGDGISKIEVSFVHPKANGHDRDS